GVAEDVLAVVEGEYVAVVEDAPAFSFVEGDRLVERVVIVQVCRVHIFGDIVVNGNDDLAIGHSGDPGRIDVEHVIGAGIGNVLGNRLGVLVGMGQLDHVDIYAGQPLPQRAREVLGFERLQPRLVGQVEGGPLVRLRRLHGTICRSIRRPRGGG